jgi:hypothetical protein
MEFGFEHQDLLKYLVGISSTVTGLVLIKLARRMFRKKELKIESDVAKTIIKFLGGDGFILSETKSYIYKQFGDKRKYIGYNNDGLISAGETVDKELKSRFIIAELISNDELTVITNMFECIRQNLINQDTNAKRNTLASLMK